MRLLSEFLRSPGEFFQQEHRQSLLIIFIFTSLFVCILLTLSRTIARPGELSKDLTAIPPLELPIATDTKWWARKHPSVTPGKAVNLEHAIGTPPITAASSKCPAYAADFKPGTYGYISIFPPYENLIHSGPGTDFSRVGYIEAGGWVKILDFPICAEDAYVWLKVQSADSSSSWTAGGHRNAQWIFPCSDLTQMCTQKVQAWLQTPTAALAGNQDRADRCASERLAVGLDAQVSPTDLLVLRTEPYSGRVLGHIPPTDVVTIIEGPRCEGGGIWWKVTSEKLSGWAVENLLKPCPKEGNCDAWEQNSQ